MLLQDIFDQLTYGELANLAIGGASEGGITTANTPKVINHINLALSALYVRFILVQQELIISTIDGQTMYLLDSAYAISNNDEGYIIDSDESPFLNDITLVTDAFDERGNRIGIDDPNDPTSIFFPKWNTLQVPSFARVSTIYLIYNAKAQKIDNDADPETTEVYLPDVLMEPLLAYVASRIHTSRGSPEAMKEGMTAMNKYIYLCDELKRANVLNNTNAPTNDKPEKRGWV